jgi:catechol-2,3-dioxygenase
MTQSSTNNETIHPTLHHFGLTTANLEPMVEWYNKVLGTKPNHESSHPAGAKSPPGLKASWVTNDKANHRIAIMSLPGLKDDPERAHHHRLQHVAFELKTVDEFLATYARLKKLGIEPVLTADHGASTAFYYNDPDRNSVELTVDNFGDWNKSSEYMRTSPEFAARPIGSHVDPEKMIKACGAGMSPEELHKRGYAGEFPPEKEMDPAALM